jgi:TolA-binding protein
MASSQDPIFGEKQPVEFNLPAPAHRQTHPAGPPPSAPPRGSMLGTLLAGGVLAFLFGGLGSWVYLNYLQPRLGVLREQSPQPAQSQVSTKDRASILAKLDDLTGKVDQMQSRVDQLPKPVTQSDLEPIKGQLATLQDLQSKVATIDKRVDALPAKIDENDRKITTMMADIDGVRKQVASLQTDLGTSLKAERANLKNDVALAPTSHESRPEPAAAPAPLEAGITLFKEKSYGRASEYFKELTKDKPEDARVWYFAALARGLSTRDWTGQTEQLVTQGVDREKAGKPARAQIDSAFADLTAETGKDWLAFYRQKAR